MKTELKTQHRRWLQIIIAALVVVAIILIVKSRHTESPADAKEGELGKMMGIKGEMVEKSESFKTVSGVLNIQHWVTERGVNVYFVPVNTLPMVDIEVIFDAGAARNGDKGGLAYLTNTLLADGTKNMDADQVAQSFDSVGSQYQAESQRDMATVHLRSLSTPEQLAPALKTLELILSEPAFPDAGFKREQQNALSALKQQAQNPQQVASRAFYSMLYPNQPYSNWVLGDEASMKALKPEDVRAFYQKYYTAKNAIVAIVGDLSTQDADAIAQSLTNNLPQGDKAPDLPEVTDLPQKAFKKIDFPSVQTSILMGEPGIRRDSPDYYPLAVGNHILGGNGSVTRIFNIIRNQHGLAYSAYSYFVPMHERGPFVMGCQTRNDQAPKALELMEELLKDFVVVGPNEKEVEQAKQNLLGGYALQFDSNRSICHEIAAMGFYHLPLDYFNDYKEKISQVTADSIKDAFQKHVNPEKLAIVMVGGSGTSKATTPGGPANDVKDLPKEEAPGVPSGAQG